MKSVRPGVERGCEGGGEPRGSASVARPDAGTCVGASSPAGLRVLIPGFAQWSWRQRERGLVLFGSYAAALAVGAFTWGTPTGTVVLAFAFGTHVVSAVDALRQSAFPAMGRWATLIGASGGLAVGVYAPVLGLASMVAWPGLRGDQADGYLVNCWAYRKAEPRRDDWVWYRPTPWSEPRVGRVVAARGQEVEWSRNQLRVDGQALNLGDPFRSIRPPREIAYCVPEGHVLVNPEGGGPNRRASEGLVIVSHEQIVGRAWARFYPVHERKLLQ